MQIEIDISIKQNGQSSNNGVSFAFISSNGWVNSDGDILVAESDETDLIFNIVRSKFNWGKPPVMGSHIGTFPTDGSAISIYSDQKKEIPVTTGNGNEFELPVVSNQGMTLTVHTRNSIYALYYYTLKIVAGSKEAGWVCFEYDPMIRNTGPHGIF